MPNLNSYKSRLSKLEQSAADASQGLYGLKSIIPQHRLISKDLALIADEAMGYLKRGGMDLAGSEAIEQMDLDEVKRNLLKIVDTITSEMKELAAVHANLDSKQLQELAEYKALISDDIKLGQLIGAINRLAKNLPEKQRSVKAHIIINEQIALHYEEHEQLQDRLLKISVPTLPASISKLGAHSELSIAYQNYRSHSAQAAHLANMIKIRLEESKNSPGQSLQAYQADLQLFKQFEADLESYKAKYEWALSRYRDEINKPVRARELYNAEATRFNQQLQQLVNLQNELKLNLDISQYQDLLNPNFMQEEIPNTVDRLGYLTSQIIKAQASIDQKIKQLEAKIQESLASDINLLKQNISVLKPLLDVQNGSYNQDKFAALEQQSDALLAVLANYKEIDTVAQIQRLKQEFELEKDRLLSSVKQQVIIKIGDLVKRRELLQKQTNIQIYSALKTDLNSIQILDASRISEIDDPTLLAQQIKQLNEHEQKLTQISATYQTQKLEWELAHQLLNKNKDEQIHFLNEIDITTVLPRILIIDNQFYEHLVTLDLTQMTVATINALSQHVANLPRQHYSPVIDDLAGKLSFMSVMHQEGLQNYLSYVKNPQFAKKIIDFIGSEESKPQRIAALQDPIRQQALQALFENYAEFNAWDAELIPTLVDDILTHEPSDVAQTLVTIRNNKTLFTPAFLISLIDFPSNQEHNERAIQLRKILSSSSQDLQNIIASVHRLLAGQQNNLNNSKFIAKRINARLSDEWSPFINHIQKFTKETSNELRKLGSLFTTLDTAFNSAATKIKDKNALKQTQKQVYETFLLTEDGNKPRPMDARRKSAVKIISEQLETSLARIIINAIKRCWNSWKYPNDKAGGIKPSTQRWSFWATEEDKAVDQLKHSVGKGFASGA